MGHGFWTSVAVGAVLAAVILGIALWVVPSIQDLEGAGSMSRSRDNVRTMITLMIGSRSEKSDSWSAYSGKNLILSLVATDQLGRRDKQRLELLWPPRLWKQFEALPPDAYDEVTEASLKTKRFPHLTGYVGPGDLEPGWKGARPLIGDVTFEDGAIIGFSDGSVRWLDREELGLDDDDPIRCGPASKSPLLRMLSDE